jgi:hypothetical protein
MYQTRDPSYALPEIRNYATTLRESSPVTSPTTAAPSPSSPAPTAPPALSSDEDAPNLAETTPDALRSDTDSAVAAVEQDGDVRKKILQGNGIPWGVMMGKIEAALPASLRQDKNRINRLIVDVVTKIVGGAQGKTWDTEQRTIQSGRSVRFIVRR